MPQEQGAGKPARVLLVQDDPRATMVLGELLRAVWSTGLVISQTSGVAEAAQELADHGATCVLLDPPGESSPVAALQQLSDAAPHTPILVLMDGDDEDLSVAVVRAGAQDVLVKAEVSAPVLGRAMRLAIERKRSEAALALRALHDPLTSLPNRALFLDRLRVALDRSRRTGAPVVVMFLDVDDFKQINDSQGHAAGDLVLTVLADRFGRLLRPMDTVARFGGDEFTFLFEGLESGQEAGLVAERISESARQPLTVGDTSVSIAVSIGVTIVRDPDAALEETVRRADTAMYRAKALGGARFEVLSEAPADRPDRSPDLEGALRRALDRRELRVHYQPRVSLEGQTGLVGFEALVRWDHPELGLMEPWEFMPVAEETGLIVSIGDWVLEQALDQVRRLRESRPEVTVSVNLSPRQLADAGLLDRLTAAIRRGGHDPAVLCLEVPEGALAAAPELATRQLAALNELGIQLAIDDFGTGHASPADLQRMPVHILKIDRALVSGLDVGSEGTAPISAAVELGHGLGLCVVAEGVETDAQLAALRDLGCDGAQGFLFSRPVPEEGVDNLLGAR